MKASNATRVLAREPLAFETLPAEVRANVPHDMLFSVLPAHPSNQLRIERASGGREQSPVRAWPYDRDPATGNLSQRDTRPQRKAAAGLRSATACCS
jgi:hypothetical protein